MLPRSGRVGTIHTSAAEVRGRSRAAHGAFYSTISLSGSVQNPGTEGVNLENITTYVDQINLIQWYVAQI